MFNFPIQLPIIFSFILLKCVFLFGDLYFLYNPNHQKLYSLSFDMNGQIRGQTILIFQLSIRTGFCIFSLEIKNPNDIQSR